MPDFVTIPFIDALEIFFKLPRDWEQSHQHFDAIAKNPNVQARLAQYRQAYHKEEERCTHFLSALQLILDLLYPTGSRISASAHKHVDMDVHPDNTPFGDYYPEFLSVNIQRCAWEQSEFTYSPAMRGSAGFPFIWPLAEDTIDDFRRSRSGHWVEMEEACSALHECCLCYARDLLSYGPVSTHTFTFAVKDDRLHLHYYDRSLEVISTGISLVDNVSSLVALIACLGSASVEEWGILSRIKAPQPQRLSMDLYDETFFLLHSTVECSNGATLSLGETIYRSNDILGTGTCVVLAKTDFQSWKGHQIVLKISSQPVDQPSEGKILQAIREIAHSSENHKWVLDHLPDVLHYEEVSFDNLQTQQKLAEYLEPLGVNYRKKSLHLFITSGLLIPAKQLRSGEDLKRVISKLIRCYKWIYEEANILHRNITVESIMYRRDSKGTIVGVLHDFSCAVFRSESQPLLDLRKSNRSTAALDVLDAGKMPYLHVYRHDLESIMYVTVALGCYLHANSAAKKHSRIHEWFDSKSTNRKLHDAKLAFLRNTPSKTTQHMVCLAKIIARLRKLFKNAEDLQSRKKDEAWEAEDERYDDIEEMGIKGKEGEADNHYDKHRQRTE